MLFGMAVLLNFAFWQHSKNILPKWDNVMAAPDETTAALSGLGDTEIAYRLMGYFLQNAGNVGGRYESLKAYDYAALEKWFFLSQKLDDRANYVPYLAAYYFGGVEDEPEKTAHVVNYLGEHGQLLYPQKWRWMLQAIYLARYKQNDLPRALDLANKLASLKTDTAPWARQMPAFIQLKMGNKEAAYEIMVRMLASEKDKLPASEVKEMLRYICTRTLEPTDAAKNPLCQDRL
jgi:hypothetical protein